MEALFATQQDTTQKEVAQILGVHPLTVSRELKRFRQSNSSSQYKAKWRNNKAKFAARQPRNLPSSQKNCLTLLFVKWHKVGVQKK